ncbi:MAG: FHA domain-containing protein [Pseudomonadota bacterium]
MEFFKRLFRAKAQPDEALSGGQAAQQLKDRLSKKPTDSELSSTPAPAPSAPSRKAPRAEAAPTPEAPKELAAANIWDLEGDQSPAAAMPARSSSKARRNRTRLIGFESSNTPVVDLFEKSTTSEIEDEPAAAPAVLFPVGWLVVTDGPGRGNSFPIRAGMSPIGRGADQAVRLNFGDNTISRNNHAAVVFDEAEKAFLLGHGGKSNVVRLNGKPVISNEKLKDRDTISMGETTLMLKVLCDDSFEWKNDETGEDSDDDVAIA